MMTTIDETDYNTEVRKQAAHLRNAVEESGDNPLNVVVDILDDHVWFNNLTGADYGAIISDFNYFSGNVEEYRDPDSLTGSHDFETTLRRMAFAQFEADVLTAYQSNDFEE